MPRYQVHMALTDKLWWDADPVITVTISAVDDQFAELNARALISTPCDVQEIELVEEVAA